MKVSQLIVVLVSVCALCSSVESHAASGPLQLGVVQESFAGWYKSVDEPLAAIVHAATGAALTRRDNGESANGFELWMADSLRNSPDFLSWSFHLPKALVFHSGASVEVDDVVWSLEKCPALNKLAVKVEAVSDSSGWVKMTVPAETSVAQRAKLPIVLAECWIYPRKQAQAFEENWGYGTNLVSAGPYRLRYFAPERQVELERFTGYFGSVTQDYAPGLVLRVFNNSRDARTALRVGTVSAVFLPSATSIEQGQPDISSDDTLKAHQCGRFLVWARKDFHLKCDPDIDATQFDS